MEFFSFFGVRDRIIDDEFIYLIRKYDLEGKNRP